MEDWLFKDSWQEEASLSKRELASLSKPRNELPRSIIEPQKLGIATDSYLP